MKLTKLSSSGKSRLSEEKLLLIAKLGAFALFLSTIEYLIPKPVPFMRIGLANVPIMLSLSLLNPGGFLLLVVLKVAGQALVNGTLFSYIFLFSLGGSVASSLVMFLLFHLLGRHISYVGISIAGALASNLVQLFLAGLLMFGPSIRLIAPPFLIMGAVTSVLLGVFAQRFTATSHWFQAHAGSGFQQAEPVNLDDRRVSADIRLITGLIILPAFLLQPTLFGTVLLTAAALGAAAASGRRIRVLPGLIMTVSIVLANLLQANGLVLFTIGDFSVTAGALRIGLDKALTLIGLIYLSQYMVSRRPKLPGRFGQIISLQLYYFEQITERWRSLEKGGLIARLDSLLFQLEGQGDAAGDNQAAASATQSPPQARVAAVCFSVAAWALLVLGYFGLLPSLGL
ncbi:MAG: Gx transporter family protein [Spirochaetota bacterium]